MSAPVLEMEDLVVAGIRAPRAALISGVTWRVYAGEFWVVGGMPGSGKTDLMMTAAGLLPPLRGMQRLFGNPVVGGSEDDLVKTRLRIGFVFANEGRLFNGLTVAENLALPVAYHCDASPGEALARARAVLERTGLVDLEGQRPEEINRNLRERVALARALVLDPELLLLDDPLRGLDPRQVRWWLAFLSSLRREKTNLTAIVATDDFRPWLELGDQFAAIAEHRWIPLGDRAAVREKDDPIVRELLAD